MLEASSEHKEDGVTLKRRKAWRSMQLLGDSDGILATAQGAAKRANTRSWKKGKHPLKRTIQQGEEVKITPHAGASRPADTEKKYMERSIVVGWMSEEENGAAAWNGSLENHFRERRSGCNVIEEDDKIVGLMKGPFTYFILHEARHHAPHRELTFSIGEKHYGDGIHGQWVPWR
ncbi:hypothetical protein LR48_Vigan11g069000 [Vigna angularis]|uniref:Uncharacterized protein n=1 Tax=Phaseolus angularis TaxID=3914 RepID=A0A0L9VS12_PHAAN|nr:hypothetical protein LR48_Vigan11g069000 [Vigna angularis]